MYSLKIWTFKISSQIKHELTTLLTTAEAGYETSIDWSDMCSCSFAEENGQNVGCTSSSRGLNVDEFLIRLIKKLMKNLCFLLRVHYLYSRCMNGKNSRQSLVSKERLLDFALRVNSIFPRSV